MFSLIITIISIALVAALALATIYYGGNSFNRGSAEAKASQYINEGQQINGAFAMAKADAQANGTTAPVDLPGLQTAGYLAQVPAGWTLTNVPASGTGATAVAAHSIVTVSAADGVCVAVNKKAGAGTDGIATSTDLASKVYGCVNGATGAAGTIQYRI